MLRDMYCAVLSCELPNNASGKNWSYSKLYDSIEANFDIFIPKIPVGFDCIVFTPVSALYLGHDAPLELTRVWDGTPCGDGMVQYNFPRLKLLANISMLLAH